MKNTLKVVLAVAVMAFCSNVSAQTPKFAHINMNELIMSMSEYDSAMVKMQNFTKDLEKTLEEMNVERNKKLEEYTKNSASWTDLVRQSREQEIQSLSQRIQIFQESAQQSIEEENAKMMQPIYDKVNKAIEAVAKEQGITYVFDSRTLLYRAMDSKDLLPQVKQNMGIKK